MNESMVDFSPECGGALADFAVRMDGNGIILKASTTSRDFLELSDGPAGETMASIVDPEDQAKLREAQAQALATGKKQAFVCRLLRQKVLPVWVDCHLARIPGGSEFGLLAFDVSHWKDQESRLSHLITHDPLTGLPNRILLHDRIKVGLSLVQRGQGSLALLLLDLDGFKKINDSLGHLIGDELIKAVADRVKALIRNTDTLARIGGDEFGLILDGGMSAKEVEIVAKKILAAVQRPFYIEGHSLYISISIGAAIYLEHGMDAPTLLKHAEIAMYKAKGQGRGGFRLYSAQLADRESEDLSLESAMHEGIRNGEFLLHYQPIFCVATGKLKGAEALMRWERAGHGMISPGAFIPLAESNGLIELLGSWALRMACHQARQWQLEGLPDFYISVNVSPRQFRQGGFAALVENALAESGLSPSSLMLEITEGILMQDPQRSGAILTDLRACGVKVAIDDFGTGYSSLAYLKRFPISVLKIDRSFINEVPGGAEDVAIVSAVLSLARELGLTVVAEGVEVAAQLEFLAQRKCDLVQGYLTGRPMSVPVFQEKLLSPVGK